MNELLKQVRVLDPVAQTDQIADVYVENQQIETIAGCITDIPQDTTVIDGQGLVLAPGLVDLYSHSGEPGFEDRETVASLLASAIAGGFTQLAILPDTKPVVDHPAGVRLLRDKCQEIGSIYPIKVDFWGALTLNLEGQQMTELANLANVGIVGFADGSPLEHLGLLRRLLEYLKPLHKPIALVASNSKLKGYGVMREGEASIRYGLPGNPVVSETTAIASILELVATIGTPVHLMRVSTARGVELIAEAKARGIPVTASTTWMHLLLNTGAIASYDPNLRLEPPLGNPNDQKALIEGVASGVIDAIAVDHQAYTYEEKTVSFGEAPPGAIGLELALPLLWQNLVVTGKLSALTLWQSLSTKPQICLQQQPQALQTGNTANLVLFDPETTWTANQANLHSLNTNTYWLGQEIKGKVIRVW